MGYYICGEVIKCKQATRKIYDYAKESDIYTARGGTW